MATRGATTRSPAAIATGLLRRRWTSPASGAAGATINCRRLSGVSTTFTSACGLTWYGPGKASGASKRSSSSTPPEITSRQSMSAFHVSAPR